jgi:hypothetical protein
MRIAAVILAMSAGTAMAQAPGAALTPPGMTPALEPPAPALEPSYRGQTALVDAAAVGLMVLAGSTNNQGLADAGLGTYLLGAPIVHYAHHRPGRAAGSLALRVGLPVLGVIVGVKTHSCGGAGPDLCDEGPGAEAVVGLLAGMVAASVIDTAFLAKGDEAPTTRPTWSPTIAARRDGVALGFAASF